ncbi:MAG: hypothetical protein AVDCRST_MAG78-1728, partial [uncultured Rubrobacteraceae bacterium]
CSCSTRPPAMPGTVVCCGLSGRGFFGGRARSTALLPGPRVSSP